MTNWRKYNGALIPNTPPHIDINLTGIKKKIKDDGVYFARWTTEFDCEYITDFWYVICDKFIPLEQDSIDVIESLGGKYITTYKMLMTRMVGLKPTQGKNSVKHDGSYFKFEPILIFKKG